MTCAKAWGDRRQPRERTAPASPQTAPPLPCAYELTSLRRVYSYEPSLQVDKDRYDEGRSFPESEPARGQVVLGGEGARCRMHAYGSMHVACREPYLSSRSRNQHRTRLAGG